MNEQKYELIPSCGWLKFESHDDVTNKIWDTLKLRDNGGSWVYYNFTSVSSIWDLDTENKNCLSVIYEEDNSPDSDETLNMPIQSISVIITPSQNMGFINLENLVQYLQQTYDFEKRF